MGDNDNDKVQQLMMLRIQHVCQLCLTCATETLKFLFPFTLCKFIMKLLVINQFKTPQTVPNTTPFQDHS